ncbi:phage portal protein [Pararhodobacter sp. SW119]|uniref:phage portal protein n=1 Tax=Pararhodobacter sp. SW119 TaxID=2780075 RepID=UPI001ADF064C|nr:phage portal protein [Pararhodobacter sp. SW119]
MLDIFGSAPTRSGLHFGPASAMRVPAVACAVGLISETVGSLPPKLYRRADKASVPEHPAYALMHEAANDWTSASALRTQLTLDALMCDAGGFAHVVRMPSAARLQADPRPFAVGIRVNAVAEEQGLAVVRSAQLG